MPSTIHGNDVKTLSKMVSFEFNKSKNQNSIQLSETQTELILNSFTVPIISNDKRIFGIGVDEDGKEFDMYVQDQFEFIMHWVIKNRYGMTYQKQSEYSDLILTVFFSICERFKHFTIEDIGNTFKVQEIEKKQGVSLTYDELMKPFRFYNDIRNRVYSSYSEVLRLDSIQNEEKTKQQLFYEEAKEHYLNSRKNLTLFSGTMFHASVIMENFTHLIDNELKFELMQKAKKTYEIEIEKQKKDAFHIVPKGTGKYLNGKDHFDYHYFLALEVINYILANPIRSFDEDQDNMAMKFVEV